VGVIVFHAIAHSSGSGRHEEGLSMPHAAAAAPAESLRVTKKLSPTQPGAIKLARRYGDALLCVRYRRDAQGLHRYTTVELIVECTPIDARRDERLVTVQIGWNQRNLRAAALARGAAWDPTQRVWRMPQKVAKALGLAVQPTPGT